jgi:hypothetical protein
MNVNKSNLVLATLFTLGAVNAHAGESAGAAKGAQMQQLVGMGTSVAVGGMFASKCPSDESRMSCAMAAMSLSQATALLGSSSGAGDSGAANSTYNGGSPWTDTKYDKTTDDSCPTCLNTGGGSKNVDNTVGNIDGKTNANLNGGSTVGQIMSDYKKLANNLKAAGVSISPDGKTVNLPGGKTVPTSSFGSDSAMKSAGISDADLSAARSLATKTQSQLTAKLVSKMDADGAGGGGGGGYGSGGSGRDGKGNFDLKMPGMNVKKDRGANVSGMSKALGNDRIGVAGDNIFEMINRRYKSRDDANAFLKK